MTKKESYDEGAGSNDTLTIFESVFVCSDACARFLIAYRILKESIVCSKCGSHMFLKTVTNDFNSKKFK
jgi:DNA-directed RNA polymerase subunit RPC12/RpoP